MDSASKRVIVIGAGAAGLMAAEVLAAAGVQVAVYDAKPSAGRKVLMAGKGGLNITHSEPLADFVTRFDQPDWLTPMIAAFTPDDIRAWMLGLGVASFVGSSGRVFPKEMKAAPLLRQWLSRLKSQGVTLHYRHDWQGWTADGQLRFATPTGEVLQSADAVILALGGGSWAKLGSDGRWVDILAHQQVNIAPLMPANCGFAVVWSDHLLALAGQPLKRVVAWVQAPDGVFINKSKGDVMLTTYGVEGGVIYALSRALREQLQQAGRVVLHLDLLPDLTEAALIQRLSAEMPQHDASVKRTSKKQTLSNVWRKAGLDSVKANLIRTYLPKDAWSDPHAVAALCKHLTLDVLAMQPIDEAISTAGGVVRDALDGHLMLQTLPNVFCCGEMLDWDAPTGGYLLTACFASGRWAGHGVLAKLGLLPASTAE